MPRMLRRWTTSHMNHAKKPAIFIELNSATARLRPTVAIVPRFL